MRMIDKASGELGKTIAHPLQAKVDRILYLNLGSREGLELGSLIPFSRFEKIRNKIYVRQRLEELGFTVCPNGIDYKLTGIDGYSKAKQPVARIKSKLELASIALKQSDVRLRRIEELLLGGKPINSSELTMCGRRSLRAHVSHLKNKEGLAIKSIRIKQPGVDFSIYALGPIYDELTDGAFKCSPRNVAEYLEEHGEITSTDIGVQPEKLTAAISQLRKTGYEIKALGVGFRKPSTYKLISKP